MCLFDAAARKLLINLNILPPIHCDKVIALVQQFFLILKGRYFIPNLSSLIGIRNTLIMFAKKFKFISMKSQLLLSVWFWYLDMTRLLLSVQPETIVAKRMINDSMVVQKLGFHTVTIASSLSWL